MKNPCIVTKHYTYFVAQKMDGWQEKANRLLLLFFAATIKV